MKKPEIRTIPYHCSRLERVLPTMDQDHNLMVISHQAVIRCILAFLLRIPGEELPYVKVPLHCILKVTFGEGENSVEYHHLPVECVDTYRPKTVVTPEEAAKDSAAVKMANLMHRGSTSITNLIEPCKSLTY